MAETDAVAFGVRVLLRAFRVKRALLVIVGARVAAPEGVDRQVQLVAGAQVPQPLRQQRIRFPLVGIERGFALAAFFVALAVYPQGQRPQLAEAGRAGQRVRVGAIDRGMAEFIGSIRILALPHIIVGRLGDQADRAAQARHAARRAGTDPHFAQGFRIKVIAAGAETVHRAGVRLRRRVRQADAVHVQADAVALDAADVVTGIAGAIPDQAGTAGFERRADQGFVAQQIAHAGGVAARQLFGADDAAAIGPQLFASGLDQDFRQRGLARGIGGGRFGGGTGAGALGQRRQLQQGRREQAQQRGLQCQVQQTRRRAVEVAGTMQTGRRGRWPQMRCAHDDPGLESEWLAL